VIRAGCSIKRFPALVERALEIFRHSYFLASARNYDERRADTTIKAIRSEEVNRSRRRKISARGSKDGKLPFVPAKHRQDTRKTYNFRVSPLNILRISLSRGQTLYIYR